ncbi:MAG: FAD-binding oxidoreductase [Gammaproteobacteria bacterium]|nr:FAD-binding oxidoreductase [Gammaproteobacteria bacterium]
MNKSTNRKIDVTVIGAGIIGLAIAEKLSSEGKSVLLVEREKIAAGASYGNAAGLAFSEFLPLASPGLIKKAAKWFLDPLGPFAVVAQDLPHTLPWLLRFLAASRPAQFRKSINTQAALMHLGRSTMYEMLERMDTKNLIKSRGALYLYQNESNFEADLSNWQLRKQHGCIFEHYKGDKLHAFQNDLPSHFSAAIFTSDWESVSNPYDFCVAIHDHISKRGVTTIYQKVNTVLPTEAGAKIHLENGNILSSGKVVIAAGPWSSLLSRQLGDKIPLIGERGYNTTLPKSALKLDQTLVFPEHGFVISSLSDGIRIGGASEVAKLDRPANYRRSKAMLNKAKRLMPALNTEGGKEWMGARPAIPDTLPVIGYSTKSKNIVYAFGHGHLGLTQSSATGQLVSEIINNNTPSIDMTALRADRF